MRKSLNIVGKNNKCSKGNEKECGMFGGVFMREKDAGNETG